VRFGPLLLRTKGTEPQTWISLDYGLVDRKLTKRLLIRRLAVQARRGGTRESSSNTDQMFYSRYRSTSRLG
jgi:hypothetical protein